MKVTGKVIVVTGAGSGMGRELVLELLRRGARVAAVDVNEKSLAETLSLAKAGPDAVEAFTLSVADKAAVEALPHAVIARFSQVDGVINNAGVIQPFVPLKDLDYAQIDRVLDVNFRGTLYMTKAFLPLLLERPEAHVVNISSMGGFLPVPGQTMYGASKAAVKLMTEGLHAELLETRVRVTVVFPGGLDTNIMTNSGLKMPSNVDAQRSRLTKADKAARDTIDGMERDAYRVLIGSDAKLVDVLYRLNPRRAAGFIAKQIKEMLPP
jgi:NAD(P)-dependent dehydrogenase (short-subunit alcohol dehydrogenase family)